MRPKRPRPLLQNRERRLQQPPRRPETWLRRTGRRTSATSAVIGGALKGAKATVDPIAVREKTMPAGGVANMIATIGMAKGAGGKNRAVRRR
jgi:hypothetical protein